MKELLELSTALLAATLGLWFYKRLNGFHRLMLWQVIVYLILDSIGIYIARIESSNGWVYTIQIPIETALLFAAVQAYFGSKTSRNVLIGLFGSVMCIFLADLLYFVKITDLAHHAVIVQYILAAGVFIVVLYSAFMYTGDRLYTAPYIVMAIGSVVYFLGTVPYLCIMFYFQEQDPIGNDKLFMLIILSLGLLRYLFVAIAFALAGINGKKHLSDV